MTEHHIAHKTLGIRVYTLTVTYEISMYQIDVCGINLHRIGMLLHLY